MKKNIPQYCAKRKGKRIKAKWIGQFLAGRIWQTVFFDSHKGLTIRSGRKGEQIGDEPTCWEYLKKNLTADEIAQLTDEQKAFQETIYQGIANKLGEPLHVGYPFGKEEEIQTYEPNN
jgi:hypothetical protein